MEKSARALYPVFAKRDRPLLRQFINVPSESTVYFLFQGSAPLELTVHAPEAFSGQVVPRPDPAAHSRLLRAWWADYSAAAESRDAPRDYPQMVEEYLTATLARRTRLPLPRRTPPRQLNLLRGELSLLSGSESTRLEIAERILLGDLAGETASVLLGEELPLPQPELLAPPAEVPIEPIAMRVPVECLYVRFGSFPNFLWLRHRMEDWGGELRDVVSERGLDYGINDRMQRQLGLREGKLAEVLGDRVIADVALIGTDAFMNEGAAIGTLFHAKSNAALKADLTNQRLTSMREAGGSEEKLSIGGKEVSYVHTADGTIRSYYAVDGDFHLVTTCRQIMEWFLATGNGSHASLGASADFRHTRFRMPLTRNDTVFVYLSPEFFDNLLSAHYHIEMLRTAPLRRGDGAIPDRPACRPRRATGRLDHRRADSTGFVAGRIRRAFRWQPGDRARRPSGRYAAQSCAARFCPCPTCRSTRSRQQKPPITARSRSTTSSSGAAWTPSCSASAAKPCPKASSNASCSTCRPRRYPLSTSRRSAIGWASRPTSGWRPCRATWPRSKPCSAAARSSPATSTTCSVRCAMPTRPSRSIPVPA